MKRGLSLCLILSLLLVLAGCGAQGGKDNIPFSGGSGTEADPYQIAAAQDLWEMAELVNQKENQETYASACYVLTADIDLGSKNWDPIGPKETPFAGTLDGNGHTIRGIKLSDRSSHNVGFFGYLKGTVRNLTIADSSIQAKGDSAYAGAFAGSSYDGTIENCHTTNTVEVTAFYEAGGICGNVNSRSTLSGCTNAAKVVATADIGGAAGIAYYVSCPVTGCTNNGTIESAGDAAGVVGSANGGISDCVNNGSVNAASYAAGVACRFSDGALNHAMNDATVTLRNCTNNGNVTSQKDPAGGITVSCRTGQVINCVNNGSVTAPAEAGGIFAYFQQGVFGEACPEFLVSGCTNNGSVTALDSYAAGGICGEVYGSSTRILFENCENTGAIRATGKPNTVGSGSEAGGIIGCANVTVLELTDCRNSGAIQGFAYAGGIVGRAYVDHGVEAAQTEFSITGCSNSGSVHTAEPGGMNKDIYAGGIVGHCRVITEDPELLPAFDLIREENCNNSGSITADHEKAIAHCGDIFGNIDQFHA